MTNEEREKEIRKLPIPTQEECIAFYKDLVKLADVRFVPYYKMAIKALEQKRWIPVNERLPEKHDCYLVTTKWKGSYSGDVYIETNMAVYRKKPKEWSCVDVIAWMPLPEPYKAESEEV